MDRVFPFGFPGPTAFYLTLYVLTLLVHVIFMNYVLAGTGYLAIAGAGRWLKRRRSGEPAPDALFDILRDWMPFALGAAITAAIAPLLFLQILYKEAFYTANLLLFHRWMSILPVLIVGFYLLYLIRSKWMEKRSPVALIWATLGALACFAFTGYAWTENHLLSLDRWSWPGHYGSHAMMYRPSTGSGLVVARFVMWAAGSVATMATILGWQVQQFGRRNAERGMAGGEAGAAQRLAKVALAGISASVVAGIVYAWYHDRSDLAKFAAVQFQTPDSQPYFYLAILGAVFQFVSWGHVLQVRHLSPRTLVTMSASLLATILGVTVQRESFRLQAIEIARLYEQHAQAAQIGGWWIFVFFVAVNAGLIAYCIRLVRRGTSVGGAPTAE